MNGKRTAVSMIIAFIVVGGAAGCGGSSEDAPTTASPSASAPVDATPGVFDADEARDVLSAIVTTGPGAWKVNTATTKPGQAQSSSADFYSEPFGCTLYYDLIFLRFVDDLMVAPEDTMFDATYRGEAEAGSDEPNIIGALSIRVLDDPSRGRTDVVDAVTSVPQKCLGAFKVYDTFLGWVMQDVASVEPLPEIAGLPEGVSVAGVIIHSADDAPDALWVWATLDNLALVFSFDVQGDITAENNDLADALVLEVVSALAAH